MASPNEVSILLPSAYRAKQLHNAIEMLLDSTDVPIELLISVVNDDDESMRLVYATSLTPFVVRTREQYERGAVYAWNTLAHLSRGDVLALWADDLVPEYGWLERALSHLEALGDGLVGLNDLHSDGTEYAAHWIASRRFLIDHMGGVMYPPCYKSWWADREITDKAIALGKYRYARDAVVEHLNYTFGVSKVDNTYRDAAQNYAADEALYKQRKAAGFPIDYQAVIE